MKVGEAAALYRLAQEMADILDRDAPLAQVLTFLRVAMSGDQGVDQGQLADTIPMSPTAASRNVRALGPIHYQKDRPGYNLVESAFDPTDNRHRVLKLNSKGERALARLSEALKKGGVK